MDGHLVSALASGFDIGEGTEVEPAHFWSQGQPVNGGRSWQLIVKHDLTHWPMDGHLVSSQVSGFHIGEGTDVEPAHFWSQGPPVNGSRSWQLIIKHDLTHWLHDRTFCVHPSIRVSHR